MKYFPSDFIEKVRSANDIVSLIQDDTHLKERGDRYVGLCPFPDHQEKTPSFSCSPQKQVYYCFGCQKSGDIFTYLQERRGMTFLEALKYLAEKARLPLPKTSVFKSKGDISSYYQLNREVSRFYQEQLEKSPVAQEYLKQRGYDSGVIKTFELGYAPKGNLLLKHLKFDSKKKKAFELGLLSEKQGSFYDTYRDRIVFPIVSTRQQTIGFGARAMGEALPKYINSKESKIFHKGKGFYGLHQSAPFLKSKNKALIVEGYTDFISLWQKGVKNVVASLGTALTPEQARLLTRYVPLVVLIFDGDTAGEKAMERSGILWLAEGFEVRGITLPNKQDPDQFVNEQGATALESLIQNSEDLFFQILKKKLAFLKENKRSLHYLINEMVPFLKHTKNPSLQALYKQRVLDCFGMDAKIMEKVLEEALKSYKMRSSEALSLPVAKLSSEKSIASALPAERLILALSLDSEEMLKDFLEESALKFLKNDVICDIFKKLQAEYGQNPKNFVRLLPSVMNQIKEKHWLLIDSYPLLKGETDRLQIFRDCLEFLKKRSTHSEASRLIAELKMNDEDDFKSLEKIFRLTRERLNRSDKI